MKIAIPVKTNKENPAVAPLFGKAKWFAIVDIDNNKIVIEPNPFKSGAEVIKWLYSLGVKALIIKEMGSNPYEMVRELGLEVFYAGDGRVELDEVVKNFKENKLALIDEKKMSEIIKHHERKHTH